VLVSDAITEHNGVLRAYRHSRQRGFTRRHLPKPAWLDRPTGQPIRRGEPAHPGELLHADVKKFGRLREGGGWRVHGRDGPQHAAPRVGYEYVHCAIDDHTRIAYAEIHRAQALPEFLHRYNHHRAHTSLGGKPPITRVDNLTGHYS
jgi:hypothetical protein